MVFLADVNSRPFPSTFAKRVPDVPYEGRLRARVDPQTLADNDNYDHERRLMYVALTRAERFLFVSRSGKQRSTFFKELQDLVAAVGEPSPLALLPRLSSRQNPAAPVGLPP